MPGTFPSGSAEAALTGPNHEVAETSAARQSQQAVPAQPAACRQAKGLDTVDGLQLNI
jgi:hypothetical protein